MFTYANESLSIKICANLHNLNIYIVIEMLWQESLATKEFEPTKSLCRPCGGFCC